MPSAARGRLAAVVTAVCVALGGFAAAAGAAGITTPGCKGTRKAPKTVGATTAPGR